MADNDASKVQLILDGEIYLKRYEPGETEPTGTDFDPTANGYAHLGYYSEEGHELTPQPGDTTEFNGHNGDVVDDDTLPGFWTSAFSGLETRKELVEAYFETDVQPDGSYKVTTAATNRRYSMFIRGIAKNDQLICAHFAKVGVSDREAITFNRTTLRAYGLTFKTFKDTALGYHFQAWDTLLAPAMPPSVASVLPTGKGAGELVTITGLGFVGITSVKFGDDEAAHFTVDSATQITAILPPGDAGSAPVKVANAIGESAPKAYTRA